MNWHWVFFILFFIKYVINLLNNVKPKFLLGILLLCDNFITIN